MVVPMGLVHVLQLELSMGNMHVHQPWMMVLVLVGRGQVGPLVTLPGFAVMDDMRMPVGMGYGVVFMARKLMASAFLRLRLPCRLRPAGLAELVEDRLDSMVVLHGADLRTKSWPSPSIIAEH